MRALAKALSIAAVLAAAITCGALLGSGASATRSPDVGRCVHGHGPPKAQWALASCVQYSPITRKHH